METNGINSSAYSTITPAYGVPEIGEAPLMQAAPSTATPQPESIAAKNEDAPYSSLKTRLWGVAETASGLVESAVGVGVGLATAWTGVGAVVGGAVALHGADGAIAGIRQIFTGEEKHSLTSQGLASLTGSETAGELIDAGIGLVGTAGAGAATNLLKGERMAAKTLEWTRQLPAGTGYTEGYGSMVLSKLGSALDRAQVFLHEKVHSVLSPGVGNFLAGLRANARTFLYANSGLMRYAEEALAESVAQLGTRAMSKLSFLGALKTGLAFPIINGYTSGARVAVEGAGVAAKLASTEHQVENAVINRMKGE